MPLCGFLRQKNKYLPWCVIVVYSSQHGRIRKMTSIYRSALCILEGCDRHRILPVRKWNMSFVIFRRWAVVLDSFCP